MAAEDDDETLGEQAEEGDTEGGHIWSVDELEGLLAKILMECDPATLQANMEYEATLDKYDTWDKETLEKEISRAQQVRWSPI